MVSRMVSKKISKWRCNLQHKTFCSLTRSLRASWSSKLASRIRRLRSLKEGPGTCCSHPRLIKFRSLTKGSEARDFMQRFPIKDRQPNFAPLRTVGWKRDKQTLLRHVSFQHLSHRLVRRTAMMMSGPANLWLWDLTHQMLKSTIKSPLSIKIKRLAKTRNTHIWTTLKTGRRRSRSIWIPEILLQLPSLDPKQTSKALTVNWTQGTKIKQTKRRYKHRSKPT